MCTLTHTDIIVTLAVVVVIGICFAQFRGFTRSGVVFFHKDGDDLLAGYDRALPLRCDAVRFESRFADGAH